MSRRAVRLDLGVLAQPDDTTCGPTCLHAVYRFFGDSQPLHSVTQSVAPLPQGGTLAVSLALHALRRGYRAQIITYNLTLFDPTWFAPEVDLSERLARQRQVKRSTRLRHATDAYLEYLALGGSLAFEELSESLICRFLDAGIPLLTGLSATYLYGCAREHEDEYDDLKGRPTGHFVILTGYDRATRRVSVADPLRDNPGFGRHYYEVSVDRLIAAIMLGIVTYDANLLALWRAGDVAPVSRPPSARPEGPA